MKGIEKVLDVFCVGCTIVFFLAVTVMVLAQAFAAAVGNGAMSVALLNRISQPAGMVAAVTTVTAIGLAYIRGQMSS